jgi:hypothetical protein
MTIHNNTIIVTYIILNIRHEITQIFINYVFFSGTNRLGNLSSHPNQASINLKFI